MAAQKNIQYSKTCIGIMICDQRIFICKFHMTQINKYIQTVYTGMSPLPVVSILTGSVSLTKQISGCCRSCLSVKAEISSGSGQPARRAASMCETSTKNLCAATRLKVSRRGRGCRPITWLSIVILNDNWLERGREREID